MFMHKIYHGTFTCAKMIRNYVKSDCGAIRVGQTTLKDYEDQPTGQNRPECDLRPWTCHSTISRPIYLAMFD
jgi:hypothetical protein